MSNSSLIAEIPEYSNFFCPIFYEAWNDFMTADPEVRAACGLKGEAVREMWFPGGRGSTKSSFVSLMLVSGLIAHPNANAIVFRKHQTDIKDSVYTQIYWAIERLGQVDNFLFYTSPARIVYKPTGQKIYFYGSDDASKRKSIKPARGYFKYMWLEEMDQFAGMKEVRSLRQSCFRGGDVCVSFYSFNPPESSRNWVNAEALRYAKGRKVYRTDYRDIVDYHPEWLGDTFIEDAEDLRNSNYDLYRHVYLGESIGTGAEIFSNLLEQEITDEQIAAWDGVEDRGMDFGFTNDPTVATKSHYDKATKTLYIYGEMYGKRMFKDDIIAGLTRLGIKDKDINGDAAADFAIGELNREGCRIHRCDKTKGFPDAGMRWLRSRTRIVIDSRRCPNTWREFSTYEYDRFHDGELKPEYPDRDNHTIDSVRYANEKHIKEEIKGKAIVMPKGIARSYRNDRDDY